MLKPEIEISFGFSNEWDVRWFSVLNRSVTKNTGDIGLQLAC